MKPEIWKRVEELYHTARVLPRGEHSAFLAKVCVDDEELRREVESLLNEPESPDGFLSRPAAEMAAHLDSELPRTQHAPLAPAAMMTGRSIGGYQLQTLLGAGGMGEVYRSHDKKLGRDVAIKILPHAFANDSDRLARFEREARMLAALNHPNICSIYGFEESEGIRFLVLELVEGETLRETLARVPKGTGLPLRDALRIARQIADALETAHERGIIHRDLKPANIKITPDGVVKVLDFGLAKNVAGIGSMPDVTNVTGTTEDGKREGAVMGTAAYMSPEQARGLAVDKRTDIWSFGCVLYQMLTGRVPFAGDTGADTVAKILERDADWSALPAETPAHIRRLLLRCLIKDPKQRLRDIGDVRFEIDAPQEMRPERSEITVAAKSRTRWLPWVAFVALAAAVGVREVRRAPAEMADPLEGAKITPITNWPGDEGSAEMSPNGEMIVFLADRDADWDVFLTEVGTDKFDNRTDDIPSVGSPTPTLRNLGFNGDATGIFFSPQEGLLLNASNSDTEPKQFMQTTGANKTPILGKNTQALAWSPDLKSLAYFTVDNAPGPAKGNDVLFVADSTGAEPRRIFENPKLPPGQVMHNHNPVWSAESDWLYFVQGVDSSGKMHIMRVRPTEGSQPENLTPEIRQNAVNFIAPLNKRTLLYVGRSEDRSGPWLWALDIETGNTRRVSTGLLEKITSVSASTDGRYIVLTSAKPTTTLYTVPLRLDRIAEESEVRPFLAQSGRALAPRFFNKILFYLSSSGAVDALWRWDGQNAREFRRPKPENGAVSEPAAVSRKDGRVVVVVNDNGKRRLEIMDADGFGVHKLASAESIDIAVVAGQGAADWSPDGNWIVAGGTDASGRMGLFKIPVNGGEPMPLVPDKKAAFSPVWSPDNKLIVYSGKSEGGQVTLYGVTPDGEPVEIRHIVEGKAVALHTRSGGYRFLPDEKVEKLMFVPTGISPDFWVLDIATQKASKIAQLSEKGRQSTFDIMPDGKSFVFDRTLQNSDIVLIDLSKQGQSKR